MGNSLKRDSAEPGNKRKAVDDINSDESTPLSDKFKLTGRVLVKNCHTWRWINDGLSKLSEDGKVCIKGVVTSKLWFCVDHSGRISQISCTDPIPDECLFDTVIDAGGRIVLPGLMDSHIHVGLTGESAHYVDLSDCNSISAMKTALSVHAKSHPELPWIIGINWDQTNLSRYPTRHDIDEVVSDRPVFLWRACWHIGVANSAAMELGNIDLTRKNFDVEGGSVDTDEFGPTGILRENAVQLLTKAMEKRSLTAKKQFLRDGLNQCLRMGLTSVQTNDEQCVEAYLELQREQEALLGGDVSDDDKGEYLPIRVFLTPNHAELGEEDNVLKEVGLRRPGIYTLLPSQDVALLSPEDSDTLGDVSSPRSFLCIDRVKIFTDGSLGAATAAINIVDAVGSAENKSSDSQSQELSGNVLAWAAGAEEEDVSQSSEGRYQGMLIHKTHRLIEMVRSARSKGFRLEVHCIGDRAAEQTLTAFENGGVTPEERPIMTHCQVLSPSIIARMKAIGAVANVQPSFVPTDMRWVQERLSTAQIEHSYCWKTLLQNGVWVAGGSDSPIETCSPFVGMYDAIFRMDRHVASGSSTSTNGADESKTSAEEVDVFRPSEKFSFAEALWTYTVGAAYACGSEKVLGQVKENYAGDFLVVDTAVLTNHSLLKELTPDVVVVGGHLKHACDEIFDGNGRGRGVHVYFPRSEAGEIDGDDIQVAAYHRYKKSRTSGRNDAVKIGGDFAPGKNGPRGLLSQRAIKESSYHGGTVIRDNGSSGEGVRARASISASGFFCACWLRGKMCQQPFKNDDHDDGASPIYCLPTSASFVGYSDETNTDFQNK